MRISGLSGKGDTFDDESSDEGDNIDRNFLLKPEDHQQLDDSEDSEIAENGGDDPSPTPIGLPP
jgi:hypothetical protein